MHRQGGGATLVAAVVMLALMAAIAFAAFQVSIGEQRSMANEMRAQAATTLAETAAERGVAYLARNAAFISSTAAGGWMSPGAQRWSNCAASSLQLPCGDGRRNLHDAHWTAYGRVFDIADAAGTGTARVHYLAPAATGGQPAPLPSAIIIVGEGMTDDGSGSALVQQQARIFSLIAHFPPSTLMVGGRLQLGGDASVVPGADAHAPHLSVWAGDDVTFVDDARSCGPSEFMHAAPAACPVGGAGILSDAAIEGVDVVDVDGDQGENGDGAVFPPDLMAYVFGVDAAQWPQLRSQAQPLADCGTLSAASRGFYWTGQDCVIPPAAQVGSVEAPVVLLIAGGAFNMRAGSAFHGLVFLYANGAAFSEATFEATSALHGSLVADADLVVEGAEFALKYRGDIASHLVQGAAAPMMLAKVPGTWRDY